MSRLLYDSMANLRCLGLCIYDYPQDSEIQRLEENSKKLSNMLDEASLKFETVYQEKSQLVENGQCFICYIF